jgi:hypothetical protein
MLSFFSKFLILLNLTPTNVNSDFKFSFFLLSISSEKFLYISLLRSGFKTLFSPLAKATIIFSYAIFAPLMN